MNGNLESNLNVKYVANIYVVHMILSVKTQNFHQKNLLVLTMIATQKILDKGPEICNFATFLEKKKKIGWSF